MNHEKENELEYLFDMLLQKRYNEGYNAFGQGKTPFDVFFDESMEKRAWRQGWEDAKDGKARDCKIW